VIICVAGDVHGALDRLYADVLGFETALGVRFDWVLQVGDLGVWPNPFRADRATQKRGVGDFPAWWLEHRRAPRPTLFVQGNHEDFQWLDTQPTRQIIGNLHWLPNGETFDLGGLVVGGVGGCYGKRDYQRPTGILQGRQRRHYTREQIDRLLTNHNVDVLLTHDAPAGVRFPEHRYRDGWVLEAQGLDELVRRLRPRLMCFGHHHVRFDSEVHGVVCRGLARVGTPRSLVGFDFSASGDPVGLGDWPIRDS